MLHIWLIALHPFALGQNCPKKYYYDYNSKKIPYLFVINIQSWVLCKAYHNFLEITETICVHYFTFQIKNAKTDVLNNVFLIFFNWGSKRCGHLIGQPFLVPRRCRSRMARGLRNEIDRVTKMKGYILNTYTSYYYSTNCNTIQIWSWCSRYLSSVGNRYPAVYVALYVGRKSEVKKCRQRDLKMLRVLLSICWIIKQLSCSISRNIVWF